jgi:hypothetical protein
MPFILDQATQCLSIVAVSEGVLVFAFNVAIQYGGHHATRILH